MGYTRGGGAKSERKRRKTKQTTAELPQDVVTEILLRLPVRSLVRSKCVCKLWYDLMRCDNFVDTYRNRHYIQEKNGSFFCVGLNTGRTSTTVTFRFCHGLVDLTLPYFVENVKIVGCSNGIVCLSISIMHDDFVLWNAATNQFKRSCCLTDGSFSNANKPQNLSCGFFFDHVTNTYKVARIAFYPRANKYEEKVTFVQINVFSSKENTWREKKIVIPACPNAVPHCDRCKVTCVRRRMYWSESCGFCRSWVESKYILCFDMVNELFKQIALPPFHDRFRPWVQLATGYRESLSVFVRRESGLLPLPCDYFFDVWVLSDCDGSNQTWSKQLTFRASMYTAVARGYFSTEGVDLMLLAVGYGCFLLRDPHTGNTKTLSMRDEIAIELFLYKESLASVV